ncbi:MAG: hypothetical protein E7812_16920 [Phenylobacterium sp.]|nr:MAG: hypothetical protein E7812_16920 [Phenylobacterium sp.]
MVVLSRIVVASSGTLIVLITSRLLGPTGRGTFAAMQAAALLIGTAVSFSMWLGVSVRIAKSRETANQALPFALLASICSVPLLVGLAFASLPSSSSSLAARLTVAAAAMAIMVYSIIQGIPIGLGRMRDYSRADIIRGAATVVLICCCLAFTRSTVALTAMIGAGYVVATLVLVAIVPIGPRTRRPSWRAFSWPTFLDSARVHPANIIGLAVFRLDIIVMAVISTKANVAVYSLASAFAEGVWLVPAAIGVIGFSDVARASTHEARRLTILGLKRALVFGTGTALAIGGVATLAVPLLLSKAYGHAILPLWISLAGAVVYSICQATAPFIMIGLGRRLLMTLITAATLVINIGLLLVLGPKYGAVGASTASSIAYATAGVLVLGLFVAVDRSRTTGSNRAPTARR